MILKQIVLQNFRSYGGAPTTIELGRGVSLFEGDIGSGKSTILYAVEFALFGLGELEARYLLRASSDSGRVALDFEVNGQEYTVVRSIERKKGVKTTTTQTRGWIREPGESLKELSPTELRSRILHILNFREKQSIRSSSRIFRYAIFTPQELMKEVLMQRPDERLETLRRAFGIEDYSFASVNTESVISQLDTRVKVYQENAKSLPDKEKELAQVQLEFTKDKSELAAAEIKLTELQKSMEDAASRLLVLEAETKRIVQLQTLIPALEAALGELRRELASEKTDLERDKKSLLEVEAAETRLASLKTQYDEYQSMKGRVRELDGLYQEQRKLSDEISRLAQIASSKETRAKTELASIENQIGELAEKLEILEKEISEASKLENSLLGLRKQIQDFSEIQSNAEEISSKTGSTQALISSKTSELERAKKKLGALQDLTRESICPLCGQTLTPEHLTLVSKQFEDEIYSLGRELDHYRAALSELALDSKQVSETKVNYQRVQSDLIQLEKQLARAKEIAVQKENARAKLAELDSRKKSLTWNLNEETFAREEKSSLLALDAKRQNLLSRLEDYEMSQYRLHELEDLGIVRLYQNSELTASRKGEVLEAVERKEKRISELTVQLTTKGLEIKERRAELEEGEPLIYELARLKEQMETFRKEFPSHKGNVERLTERVKQENARIDGLQSDVANLRKSASKANTLKGISSWLAGTFLPAISDIERYVLASINDEFKDIFQRIFSKLVEESDLRVGVDDRFTPIVEQSGYELEVSSLSGGERTAVALAYRLALNYMVKRANEAMQQANLLILDEPTEGFSPEQIYRFRNALEELSCDQVIIVSHERDLEPVSDRVYRVEKVNNESILTTVT